jgi:uncharacterized protein YggE
MKKKLILLISGTAIVVLASVMLVGCQAANTGTSISAYQQTGISVSGQGKVTATPDVANIQLGIQAQAATVAGAQAQATKAMNDVMTALASNGVAQKDIQTQYFNISQTTSWDNTKNIQIVTGYQVTNSVTAKIRDISKAGSVIDSVAAAGGDLVRVNGVQFAIDDPTAINIQARDLAMADAKASASQLAKAAGVTLGNPISITESSSYAPQNVVYAKDAASGVSSTPISAGQMDITLSVQVVYSIK